MMEGYIARSYLTTAKLPWALPTNWSMISCVGAVDKVMNFF
jgi:hypothetical protein